MRRSEGATTALQPDSWPVSSGQHRVLIVEDDVIDARILASMLERIAKGRKSLGLEVVISQSLAGVPDALSSGPVDVVLLDLDLPDGDGGQSLVAVGAVTDAPIVVVSGTGSQLLVEGAIRLGAKGFLRKGQFDEHHLWNTIRFAWAGRGSTSHTLAKGLRIHPSATWIVRDTQVVWANDAAERLDWSPERVLTALADKDAVLAELQWEGAPAQMVVAAADPSS